MYFEAEIEHPGTQKQSVFVSTGLRKRLKSNLNILEHKFTYLYVFCQYGQKKPLTMLRITQENKIMCHHIDF